MPPTRLALLAPLLLAFHGPKTWDFRADEPGKIPRGFTAVAGRWEVVDDGGNRVLAQRASSPDDTFNVALVDDTNYKDVDISVRLKAVDGKDDRGGGLVWRAVDGSNYYVARYNPLEDNLRVYKVEKGTRTMFRSAEAAGDARWHALRVTMVGDKITCWLDDRKLLEAADGTFAAAGRIGVWSKADARTYFDDLEAAE